MSEDVEMKLLQMFDERMEEITIAYRNLRKWTYTLIAIFGIGLLSAVYWAGIMSEKLDSMTASVDDIKAQVDRMEAKYNDIVWFMIAEFHYEPKDVNK